MLSGKLKTWVESHLNRKKSGRNKHSAGGGGNGGRDNKYHHESPMSAGADRIAHPASSLVSLTMPSVPTMIVCSSNGGGGGGGGGGIGGTGSVSGRRSNAALLIQLQKDIANSSSAACSAASSSYNTPNRSHPSWTRSPVMLAWNTDSKLTPARQQQQLTLTDPPHSSSSSLLLSSPFPLHHSTPTQQQQQQQQQQHQQLQHPPQYSIIQSIYCEPSPSCSATSDWTTKSFTGESGCGSGGGGCDGSISSKATVTSDRERERERGGDSCSRRRLMMMMTDTPSLSSPESAYSTGCSADGVSPTSQDAPPPPPPTTTTTSTGAVGALAMPLTPQTLTPATTPTASAPPPLSVDTTSSMSSVWRRSLLLPEGLDGSSAQPSPRARPAIRTNPWLPVRWSSSSAASSTWMNGHPEAANQSRLLDDFFADESSASSPPPPPAPSCGGGGGGRGSDRHFDVVMDGDELRVIAQHPHATDYRFRQQQSHQLQHSSAFASCGGSGAGSWVDTDDRYAQLIRETEEMLLQLENDELLLGTTRKPEESIYGPSVAAVIKTKATVMTTTSSTPINRNVTRRRKKRLSTASRRSASRATSQSDLFSTSSSSESSDDVSTGRTGRYWSSRRRPRSANKSRPLQKDKENASERIHSTHRFPQQQNGRVQQQPQQEKQPPPVLPDHLWPAVNSNQRTDCAPDEWPEHDRPPSPAPMDPHCHRQATPVIARRNYGFVSSQKTSSSSSSSRTSYTATDRAHQLMEQERLESQIARLCQQLKDATDDYYFYEAGRGRLTPTSSDFSL